MRTVMLLVAAVGALALSVPAALATTATGSARRHQRDRLAVRHGHAR